jgi:hypothetical protein
LARQPRGLLGLAASCHQVGLDLDLDVGLLFMQRTLKRLARVLAEGTGVSFERLADEVRAGSARKLALAEFDAGERRVLSIKPKPKAASPR